MTEKNKGGRPSLYSDELAERICLSLICGGKNGKPQGLEAVCAAPGMPCDTTVYYWLHDHPKFLKMYMRAREAQGDRIAWDGLDIIDENEYDYTEDENGKVIVNYDHIKRATERAKYRQWMAARLAANWWGERIRQEHTGADGGPIETKNENTPGFKDFTPETWAQAVPQPKD